MWNVVISMALFVLGFVHPMFFAGAVVFAIFLVADSKPFGNSGNAWGRPKGWENDLPTFGEQNNRPQRPQTHTPIVRTSQTTLGRTAQAAPLPRRDNSDTEDALLVAATLAVASAGGGSSRSYDDHSDNSSGGDCGGSSSSYDSSSSGSYDSGSSYDSGGDSGSCSSGD